MANYIEVEMDKNLLRAWKN